MSDPHRIWVVEGTHEIGRVPSTIEAERLIHSIAKGSPRTRQFGVYDRRTGRTRIFEHDGRILREIGD